MGQHPLGEHLGCAGRPGIEIKARQVATDKGIIGDAARVGLERIAWLDVDQRIGPGGRAAVR
jgi:hypothetical protein